MEVLDFRWSKQKRAGTLVATFSEETQSDEQEDDNPLNNNSNDDLEDDIQNTAKELVTDWQIGDWVVVVYDFIWYPGMIQNVCDF